MTKAKLSIELEVLEPLLVGSASELLELHPSQIRWVSIRLQVEGAAEDEAITLSAQSGDSRLAIHNLVSFAAASQPEGTVVVIWFQGRSEQFVI